MKDFLERMAKIGGQAQVARLLVPERLRNSGSEAAEKALGKAKVRVHRFVKGDSQTADTVKLLCDVLGLKPFAFRAKTPTAAEALTIAEAQPDAVLEALRREREYQERKRQDAAEIAAASAMMSAESGTPGIPDYESTDGDGQSEPVDSANENTDRERRRRGRGGDRPSPSSRK